MAYNLTSIATNTTGFVGMMRGVNSVLMFGWLGTLLLIGIFFITLIGFIRVTGETNKSLAASSFIAFGISLILRAMQLLSDKVVFITLALCAVIIAMTWNSS